MPAIAIWLLRLLAFGLMARRAARNARGTTIVRGLPRTMRGLPRTLDLPRTIDVGGAGRALARAIFWSFVIRELIVLAVAAVAVVALIALAIMLNAR